MKVHVFYLEQNYQINGYTIDETGSNLPSKYGTWEFHAIFFLHPDTLLFNVDAIEIMKESDENGYSIQDLDSKKDISICKYWSVT